MNVYDAVNSFKTVEKMMRILPIDDILNVLESDSFGDKVVSAVRGEELGIGCNFDVLSYFFL